MGLLENTIKNIPLKIITLIVREFGENNKPHYHIILSVNNILGYNNKFMYNLKHELIKNLNEHDLIIELIEDFINYKNKLKYLFKEKSSFHKINVHNIEIKELIEKENIFPEFPIKIEYDEYQHLSSYTKSTKKYDEYTLINLINFYFEYKQMVLFNNIIYKKLPNKIISYEKFVEIEKIPELLKNIFGELLFVFESQLKNIDFYTLQVEYVPKIEQLIRKTKEIIINKITLNFDIIEFTDGIYFLSKDKFIPKHIFENDELKGVGTIKYYNKTYKHLKNPDVWKNAITEAVNDKNIAEELFYHFASVFNKKDELLGKKKTMYINGPSSTGKTTLISKPINNFYGPENVGLISTNNTFTLENVVNKQVVICDEAHHYTLNGGDLLKLLERNNPILIERKHKEAVTAQNLSIVFLSNKELNMREDETKEALSNRLKIYVFEKKLSENVYDYNYLVKNLKDNEINIIVYCNKLFFKKYIYNNNKKPKIRNKKILKNLQIENK